MIYLLKYLEIDTPLIVTKQKLAIITTWYPPLNGSFVEQQAEALTQHYDVSVFVAFPSVFSRKTINIERGVKVHRFCFPYPPRRASIFMKFWISAFSKRVLHAIGKVDIIIAHNYLGGIVAERVAYRMDLPFFVTLHATNLVNRNLSRTVVPFIKKSLNRAKRVICVGKKLQEVVVHDYGLSNTLIIGNMVDTSRFQIRNIDKKPFRFIMIADFNERKGVKWVVDAFVQLKDRQVELVLLGNADKSEENHIKASKDNRIIRIGEAKVNDIPTYIEESHCLISFSTVETFGITVIEAMASGLPVLYCASGGPEYIVPEWAGIKVERTVSALKEGMERMIKEHHTYDPLAIRSYTRENYDKEVIVRKLMDVYGVL